MNTIMISKKQNGCTHCASPPKSMAILMFYVMFDHDLNETSVCANMGLNKFS